MALLMSTSPVGLEYYLLARVLHDWSRVTRKALMERMERANSDLVRAERENLVHCALARR